jgi:hypothetical protein
MVFSKYTAVLWAARPLALWERVGVRELSVPAAMGFQTLDSADSLFL